MIDFDMELKKFKPAVGVELGGRRLIDDDIKDVTDLVAELVEELKNRNQNNG